MKALVYRYASIFYEVGFYLVSVFSRLTNAIGFGGSMHQTLSARAHYEAELLDRPQWIKRRNRINRLFFWQDDHCQQAYEAQIARHEKGLRLNGRLN